MTGEFMEFHERSNSLRPSDKNEKVLTPFDLTGALEIFKGNQDIDSSGHEDCEENLRNLIMMMDAELKMQEDSILYDLTNHEVEITKTCQVCKKSWVKVEKEYLFYVDSFDKEAERVLPVEARNKLKDARYDKQKDHKLTNDIMLTSEVVSVDCGGGTKGFKGNKAIKTRHVINIGGSILFAIKRSKLLWKYKTNTKQTEKESNTKPKEKEFSVYPEAFCVHFPAEMVILQHTYMLVAVISYSPSAEDNKGHYFIDILSPNNEVVANDIEDTFYVHTSTKKLWVRFNDESVYKWDSFDEMKKEVAHECVLLCYTKY